MAKRITSFENFGVTDLVAMRAEIEWEIDNRIADERQQLQARLNVLDAYEPEHGRQVGQDGSPRIRMGASDGRRRTQSLKGRKAPIKYRGPHGEMWSGRGS